ncbi:MAG: type VII toxin-antitoxin system HepT family RNase toxin [Pseudanabaena sp.]
MSRVNPAIVVAKFAYMNKYLRKLKEIMDVPLNEYIDSLNHDLAQRCLQLIADWQIGVNRHLIRGLNVCQPQRNDETPIVVSNLGIIDISLAKRLSSAISLRNVIIHLYEEIEPESLYSAISKTITDYAQYQRQILNYLDALEKNND